MAVVAELAGHGRSGTDVARETSAMVLTDDYFATIVTAMRPSSQGVIRATAASSATC